MESESDTRLERVHDALRDLGISVFWGMLTSLIAASALASCQIQFLQVWHLLCPHHWVRLPVVDLFPHAAPRVHRPPAGQGRSVYAGGVAKEAGERYEHSQSEHRR